MRRARGALRRRPSAAAAAMRAPPPRRRPRPAPGSTAVAERRPSEPQLRRARAVIGAALARRSQKLRRAATHGVPGPNEGARLLRRLRSASLFFRRFASSSQKVLFASSAAAPSGAPRAPPTRARSSRVGDGARERFTPRHAQVAGASALPRFVLRGLARGSTSKKTGVLCGASAAGARPAATPPPGSRRPGAASPRAPQRSHASATRRATNANPERAVRAARSAPAPAR